MEKITKNDLQIKEANQKFKKMNKAARRVAIAKDVLTQIEAKKLIPTAGEYFALKGNGNKLNKNIELQSIIEKPKVKCTVCALGSLFACDVLRLDQYKTSEEGNIFGGECHIIMHDRLSSYFSLDQLELIEAAFERRVVNDRSGTLWGKWGEWTELGRKAIKFGHEFSKDGDRLIAIMNNIIANKGTFII